MVIVKNRTLMFSNREQYLGTSYDDNSTIRMFQVPRISVDGVDIANLTFVANLEKMNGAKVSSYLEKEVRDDVIILHWKIQNEALNPAGTMFLSLRATDTSGDVKWSTYQASVYSETSTEAPETGGDAVLGFEQMVARSEELAIELEESEEDRAEAELLRVIAETERKERAEALYEQLDSAIESANEAAENANEAAERVKGTPVAKIEEEVSRVKSDLDKETIERKAEIATERERINQLTRMPEGSTTGDAELNDARIDKDGFIHENVGSHIRNVSKRLSNNVEELDETINGEKIYLSTNVGYKNLSNTTNDNSRRYSNPFNAKNGMILNVEYVGFDIKYNIYACDSDGKATGIIHANWITDKTFAFEYDGMAYINFVKVDSKAYTTEEISDLEKNTFLQDELTSKVVSKTFLDDKLSKEVARKTDVDIIRYVSPNGDDNADGLMENSAYKTFNRAMRDKPNVLYAERGIYQNQSIIADGLKSFRLIPYGGSNYSQDKPDREMIEIYNGTDITPTMDSNTNLLKYIVSFPSTHTYYKVFIEKSLPLYSDSSDNAPKRNAQLWQRDINNWINDCQMNPVATLDECISNKGTFTYDGTALYINPLERTYNLFTIQNDVERCIDLRNCGEVVLDDLHCRFALAHIAYIYNCSDVNINNCKFGYSRKRDNVSLDYSNVVVRKSVSYKSANDGWNVHGYGESQFYDCKGLYNADDGISHHEGAIGTVYGGIWSGNGKAGNAPTYGADINILGGLYSDNKFGLYFYSPKGYPLRDVLAQGCILKSNQFGIAYGGYNVTVSNIINGNNTKDYNDMIAISNNGGSFTSY